MEDETQYLEIDEKLSEELKIQAKNIWIHPEEFNKQKRFNEFLQNAWWNNIKLTEEDYNKFEEEENLNKS